MSIMRIRNLDTLFDVRATGLRKLFPGKPRLSVGMGTCGIGNGAEQLHAALADELQKQKLDAALAPVGCFGFCAMEPLVGVHLPGLPLVILREVAPAEAAAIVAQVEAGQVPLDKALCRIEEWDHLTRHVTYGHGLTEVPLWNEIPFFAGQMKLVLRDCGLINPEDIDEYIAIGGYQPLHDATQGGSGEAVLEEVKRANLRGRGGAGYPTGRKWSLLQSNPAAGKVLICNADEGDPGAYMNRNEIEGDPHMLLEGMLLGALATGATEGYVYLRAEYPLAVERLRKAIVEARRYGLLGENIFDSQLCFDVHVVEGAGAFVCGEETAMIASLEGKAGRPRPRPPFPAEHGLWGRPTNINNVETFCNIPVIISRGGSWFAQAGTRNSPGTKVFSLVGKIRNTGLVELPMGSPLKDIVYGIGGGSPDGRRIKAVQTGGPSGGCIPAERFDVAVDYESLAALGAIMGSGGMVVMDEDNCMVDVARYFIEFTHAESCGKCVPCRSGLDQALNVLTKVTEGRANAADIRMLEDVAGMIRDCSLCGLGQTAPNPVLTTLRYFRHEYQKHIRARRCDAGVCEELFLSPCENSCPLNMRIPGFLQLLKEDRMDEALVLVWLDNPLPASTGRVCQHPCEARCRRAGVDAPVNMRDVHRHIADTALERFSAQDLARRLTANSMPTSGKRVAVIGAGPAGLTAAFYLALLGHDVTVFEAKAEPGGMLRYSLPEYRLPKDVLRREIDVIGALGVHFVHNRAIPGTGRDLADLESGHDAIFLALGTWQEGKAGVPGEAGPGVWPAVEFLAKTASGECPELGARTVVIGGGNAAIDAARTAVRLGSDVTVVYRRERRDMPAIAEEVEEAEAEGVKLMLFAAPCRILRDADGQTKGIELSRMTPGDFDVSGRRKPVRSTESCTLDCDSIIMAIGEKPDADPLRDACITIRDDGAIDADWLSGKTDRPYVYAGGDVADGATNVVTAMASGKRAARAIDQLLTGEDRFATLTRTFEYAQQVSIEPEGGERNRPEHLPADRRQSLFAEVVGGLSAPQAAAESVRCLRCDVKAECPVDTEISVTA